jgi:hypothetical protein
LALSGFLSGFLSGRYFLCGKKDKIICHEKMQFLLLSADSISYNIILFLL